MASIRKCGDTWQAQVTRKGFPDETKTFKTKAEAEHWCRAVEANMDAGRYVSTRKAEATSLEDLLRRYRETVTPLKHGATEEAIRLKALERRKIAKLALSNVTPEVIGDFWGDCRRALRTAGASIAACPRSGLLPQGSRSRYVSRTGAISHWNGGTTPVAAGAPHTAKN